MREAMTDLSAGASWIASHAPPDAVVMSKNPVQDYLYARRLTVPYPARAGELDPPNSTKRDHASRDCRHCGCRNPSGRLATIAWNVAGRAGAGKFAIRAGHARLRNVAAAWVVRYTPAATT